MDPIVVVGAGISGVACARVLTTAGLPVSVVDRGRRLGGRMAVRTIQGRPVDTGASYLTVSDPRFEDVVQRWQHAELARPWTDTFDVFEDGTRGEPKSGPLRWGAARGLRSLVEDLAEGLSVEESVVGCVDRSVDGDLLVDGGGASAVVLAMPDPQARRLLSPALSDVAAALVADWDPVLALTTTWPERTWDAGHPFQGAFVNGDEHLAWVADDGRRHGDDAPVLVAHSTSGFAAGNLEDPEAAAPVMLAALRRLLDLDAEPGATHLQRWSLAKPAAPREAPYFLGDDLVGACGDGWSGNPKVEGAWLSGTALGEALVERLSSSARSAVPR